MSYYKTLTIMQYILEFSENQQAFHQNNGSHQIGSNGFFIIDKEKTDKIQSAFIDFMQPVINKMHVSVSIAKSEWNIFLRVIESLELYGLIHPTV